MTLPRVQCVCRGWLCGLATRCGKSEFNLPGSLSGWVRYFQPEHTGEHCEHFVTIEHSPWGHGGDGEESE